MKLFQAGVPCLYRDEVSSDKFIPVRPQPKSRPAFSSGHIVFFFCALISMAELFRDFNQGSGMSTVLKTGRFSSAL